MPLLRKEICLVDGSYTIFTLNKTLKDTKVNHNLSLVNSFVKKGNMFGNQFKLNLQEQLTR